MHSGGSLFDVKGPAWQLGAFLTVNVVMGLFPQSLRAPDCSSSRSFVRARSVAVSGLPLCSMQDFVMHRFGRHHAFMAANFAELMLAICALPACQHKIQMTTSRDALIDGLFVQQNSVNACDC